MKTASKIMPQFQAGLTRDVYAEAGVKLSFASKERGYSALRKPSIITNACGADHAHSFMFGPEGELYRCWEDFGMPEKVIGHVNNGITKHAEYIQEYMNFDPTKDKKCSSCTVMPLCMGGCPKHRMIHGEPQCGIYKFKLRDYVLSGLELQENAIIS